MSLYPCEFHGTRVPGPLESVRITLLLDNRAYSRRLRLCSTHVDQVVSSTLSSWGPVEDVGDNSADGLCGSCGRARKGNGPKADGFAWVYKRSSEPLELYSELCEPCGGKVVKDYSLQERATDG